MENLNYEVLIEELAAAEPAMTKAMAKRALKRTFARIAETVANGGRATFQGFGSFCAMDTAERQMINPQTKEMMTVPAGKRVKFVPSPAFKGAVNEK